MRVDNNITLYVGAQPTNSAATEGDSRNQDNRKTVFAGNLNQNDTLQDGIEQKKAQAKEQAMKVVGDAFAGDRAIDTDIDNRRTHVKELKEDKVLFQEEKDGIATQREDVEKAREAGDVSEAEYIQMTKDLDEAEKACDEELNKNEGEILEENATISAIHRERLKSSPMVDAQKQADEILDAASKEIIGMVADEAKEHLDAEADERDEKAEKLKEQQEQIEEFIEKNREKREETEELLEDMPAQEMLTLNQRQTDVQTEVQNILNKMKLVAEDIKGAAVDESL
jgi:chromosome segregation ATPase